MILEDFNEILFQDENWEEKQGKKSRCIVLKGPWKIVIYLIWGTKEINTRGVINMIMKLL